MKKVLFKALLILTLGCASSPVDRSAWLDLVVCQVAMSQQGGDLAWSVTVLAGIAGQGCNDPKTVIASHGTKAHDVLKTLDVDDRFQFRGTRESIMDPLDRLPSLVAFGASRTIDIKPSVLQVYRPVEDGIRVLKVRRGVWRALLPWSRGGGR